MTNWRETGYVPASDDDISDGGLSTQEEEHAWVGGGVPGRIKDDANGVCGANGEDAVEEEGGVGGGEGVTLGVGAGMKDAEGEEYLSIEHDLAVPSSGITRVGRGLSGIGLATSPHEESDLRPRHGMGGGYGDVPVVDLSNEMGESPCPNAEMVDSDHEANGDEENHDLGLLPDPTAEDKSGNLGGQPTSSATPPRARTPQALGPVVGNSSATSSPLSSPPSTVVSPPPAFQRRATRPTFEVVIPATHREGEFPGYSRSLRARKPIQKNPYLIEQERYRQTLKARGVRPVRISEVEEETNGGLGADDDSQEYDYVAPPEPENDEDQFVPRPSGRKQHDTPLDIYDFDDFPDATTSRDRPRPNGVLPDGAKRRKVAHTYSKHSTVARTRVEAARGPVDARLPSAPMPTDWADNEGDIYNLPGDVTRTASRPPLAQSSPNKSPTKENPPQELGEKRRGILTVLDSSSDVESEPNSRERLQMAFPRSPIAAPRSTFDVGVSSSAEGETTSGDDESQEVRRFQRKTAGVLPASWWKLDQRNKPTSTNDARRERRRSTTPTQDLTPRPGIARAKISSRRRSPTGDAFLFDGESDDSSSPVIAGPPASQSRARSATHQPAIEVIDLDDIVEDDRIDRMLPSNTRKHGTVKRKQKERKQSSRGSHGVGGGTGTASRGSGNRSSHLRQSRITSHASSKRKPTKRKAKAPVLGIIDAARHHKATDPKIPPPPFIKVATRSARERISKGRQSPRGKVFRLETATDTQEVQGILKDWREGTIAFRAHDSSDDGRRKGHHQARLPSPKHLDGPRTGYLGLDPGLQSGRAYDSKRGQTRQSTLTNIVRTRLLLRKINDEPRPSSKGQKSGITTVPGRRNAVTHRPYFMPEPAQFEVEAPPGIAAARQRKASRQAPQHGLANLLRQTARKNPNLGRFMNDEDLVNPQPRPPPARHPAPTFAFAAAHAPSAPAIRLPRARRKRTPTRIDADTVERRQPPLEDRITIDDNDIQPFPEIPVHDKPVLEELLPYGGKYTSTFDTIALKPGTIFNSETFVGDGGLSKALNPQHSMVGQCIGFTFGGKSIRWGVYEDSVAAEFESFMEGIADHVDNQQEGGVDVERDPWVARAYSFYGFFSHYLSQVVSFSDSIDLISFGQRVLQAVDVCCDRVSSVLGPTTRPDLKTSTRLALQLHAFGLVFAFQIYMLASEDAESQQRLELEKHINKLGRQLLGRLLRCGFDDVRACYEEQRQNSKYERGIDSGHYLVEVWVIAIHTLDRVAFQDVGFWQLLNHELRLADLERALDIRILERHWRIVFAILPLYQFDEFGAVQGPVRDGNLSENWALLRVLVGRPLKVYNSNTTEHFGTVNSYCRALYMRCHHLITKWGWLNAEFIIPTLYEFFASKSLANLRNEEAIGSPDFLQHLEKKPPLQASDSDPCFHLLLKIVALGLHAMRLSTPTSRIRNLVNRLMPNHGRQYPKEEELRLENLVALRNHHDLLATLWWAATPPCRPPLEAIRYLVDAEMSHQQACIVSIRTWSNLIRFQLHSGEDLEVLKPFMEWFDDLTGSTLSQHHAARTEAEKQFRAESEKGDTDLSKDLVEDNIRRNQRQLEGILLDAVKSLRMALAGIGGQLHRAIVVFTKASTANILNSYTRLSHKLVVEVLDLIQQYLVVCKSIEGSPVIAAVQASEDSQDYGDWSGFDDIVVGDEQKAAAEHLTTVVYEALHRMLSNCFGADKQPEESLLVKVVDTWALVVGFLVRHGLRNWDSYLDRYNSESWSSLRDTEQTRKYTAYFIPKIIQSGPDMYEPNKTTLISYWLKTLVERESLLKFQNEYTATLLNCDPGNPLLANPPFARDEVGGEFKISLSDFRSRRLSLISTVLANMREFYEETLHSSPPQAVTLKQEYSEMLQSMMKSMKEIYQELDAKPTSGSYVEFVQQVVEYLQQHSVDIVVIDKFFTDSSAFPLPSTDPTYVVGRLKNYGLKLAYPRAHKQLISFFQSVCERAALDGQQDYLVHQLTTALSDDFEYGDPKRPTLRALFLEAIFPAYIECSFSTLAGWVMAVPILQAAEMVVGKMRTGIDSTLFDCVRSVLSMLVSLLEGVRMAIGSLATPSDVLSSTIRLGTFTLMMEMVTRAIPIIDWLSANVDGDATTDLSNHAYECGAFLIRHAAYLGNIIKHREAELPMDAHMGQRYHGPHESAKAHCLATLDRSLSREWVSHGGEWHVVRGTNRREVAPPAFAAAAAGNEAQCKRGFMRVLIALLRVACRGEMFERVARALDVGVWEEEASSRGRRGRGGVGLGGVFC